MPATSVFFNILVLFLHSLHHHFLIQPYIFPLHFSLHSIFLLPSLLFSPTFPSSCQLSFPPSWRPSLPHHYHLPGICPGGEIYERVEMLPSSGFYREGKGRDRVDWWHTGWLLPDPPTLIPLLTRLSVEVDGVVRASSLTKMNAFCRRQYFTYSDTLTSSMLRLTESFNAGLLITITLTHLSRYVVCN